MDYDEVLKNKKEYNNLNQIVTERLEDLAYEIVTEPQCSCSSCAVNGFCECEPINEDIMLETIKPY